MKMLDTSAMFRYRRVFKISSQVRSSGAKKKKNQKSKPVVTLTVPKTLPAICSARKRTVGDTGRTAPGSGAAGPRLFFNSSSRQRRPGRPGQSHLPRQSAPHSCPGLYLTSGPRPEPPRHAVHRIRQCPASRAPAPPPRPPAPLHSAPFNAGTRGGARAPPPRPPPAPPPRAAPTPPSRAARTRRALHARRPPQPRAPAAPPAPQALNVGGQQRGEGGRGRKGPFSAHVPRGHGDVVEGEPDSGQQAEAPPLAGGLLLLARLRGAAVGAVLLAGRHGGRAPGEGGRQGKGSG